MAPAEIPVRMEGSSSGCARGRARGARRPGTPRGRHRRTASGEARFRAPWLGLGIGRSGCRGAGAPGTSLPVSGAAFEASNRPKGQGAPAPQRSIRTSRAPPPLISRIEDTPTLSLRTSEPAGHGRPQDPVPALAPEAPPGDHVHRAPADRAAAGELRPEPALGLFDGAAVKVHLVDLRPILLVEIGVVLGIKPAPAMTIPSGHGSYIGQDGPRIMIRPAESPPTPIMPLFSRSQMDFPRLRLAPRPPGRRLRLERGLDHQACGHGDQGERRGPAAGPQ